MRPGIVDVVKESRFSAIGRRYCEHDHDFFPRCRPRLYGIGAGEMPYGSITPVANVAAPHTRRRTWRGGSGTAGRAAGV